MLSVKSALIFMAFLAVLAVGGALAYQSEARERDYRLLLASGDAALSEGQISAAVEDFSGAIALRPDSMLAHLRRGETYRQRHDLDAAIRDFRTAATLDPTAPRPLEQWGDALYEQQRFKRAAEIYAARLALDDRAPAVRLREGLAYYRDGNPKRALEAIGRALALDDHLADAYYVSALCHRDLGDIPAAIAALKQAISRAPGAVTVREELADVYKATGQRSAEVEQLQVLAGLDGTRVERRIAIGLAHARDGKTDLAVLTLAGALEQFPNNPLVYSALGRVWLDIARARPERTDALAKALEALERASSNASATSDVKAWYGEALMRDGQFEAAERVLQQATERFPADPAAFALYAEVAEQQHHASQALNALETYQALVGRDAGFESRALKLGQLSLQVDDPAGAVPWLTRALNADPRNVAALTALADAYQQLGAIDDARATVARALVIDPASRTLLAMSRRLGKASADKAIVSAP